MKSNEPRPLPLVDEVTRPYWEAAKKHILVMQHCSKCGHYNYPPASFCARCASQDLTFVKVSGFGTLWAYSVIHDPRVHGFEDKVPYMVLCVTIDEAPGNLMITGLMDSDPKKVKVGARVQVAFEDVNDEISLPHFKLVD